MFPSHIATSDEALDFFQQWLESLGGSSIAYGGFERTSPMPGSMRCLLNVGPAKVEFAETGTLLEVRFAVDLVADDPPLGPFYYWFSFRNATTRQLIWRHDMHGGHEDLYGDEVDARLAKCHFHATEEDRFPLDDPPVTFEKIGADVTEFDAQVAQRPE